MFYGGIVLATGVLLYFSMGSTSAPRRDGGIFSGRVTMFPTALDDPLYSEPPASQTDQIVDNLPPAIGASTDGVCAVDSPEELNDWRISTGQGALSADELLRYQQDPSLLGQAISGAKTMSGCFPTVR